MGTPLKPRRLCKTWLKEWMPLYGTVGTCLEFRRASLEADEVWTHETGKDWWLIVIYNGLSMTIPLKIGWFGGTPILGNFHIKTKSTDCAFLCRDVAFLFLGAGEWKQERDKVRHFLTLVYLERSNTGFFYPKPKKDRLWGSVWTRKLECFFAIRDTSDIMEWKKRSKSVKKKLKTVRKRSGVKKNVLEWK